jgi:RNA polymerase sigma-70 factor, ECF subfamily
MEGVPRESQFRELLAATKVGDQQAMGRAYQSLQPALLGYLRAVAGPDAEDVASQTWLDVVASVKSFEGDEAAFRRWVFTIARRRVADAQRRWWRRPRSVSFASVEDIASSDDVSDRMLDWQRAAEHIRRLPPDFAEIVFLRVLAGFSAEEVGVITDRPASTVRVLQHRALHRLARELNREAETK